MNTARILASIAKNPAATDYRIAKNLGLTVGEIAAARKKPRAVAPASVASDGVDLRGCKVLPRKPADSAAGFIKRLPVGRGFEPHVLAAEWGMSEDTIRRHAKDLKCLKFVEVEDNWIPMVMHPDTAAKYHS